MIAERYLEHIATLETIGIEDQALADVLPAYRALARATAERALARRVITEDVFNEIRSKL